MALIIGSSEYAFCGIGDALGMFSQQAVSQATQQQLQAQRQQQEAQRAFFGSSLWGNTRDNVSAGDSVYVDLKLGEDIRLSFIDKLRKEIDDWIHIKN